MAKHKKKIQKVASLFILDGLWFNISGNMAHSRELIAINWEELTESTRSKEVAISNFLFLIKFDHHNSL